MRSKLMNKFTSVFFFIPLLAILISCSVSEIEPSSQSMNKTDAIAPTASANNLEGAAESAYPVIESAYPVPDNQARTALTQVQEIALAEELYHIEQQEYVDISSQPDLQFLSPYEFAVTNNTIFLRALRSDRTLVFLKVNLNDGSMTEIHVPIESSEPHSIVAHSQYLVWYARASDEIFVYDYISSSIHRRIPGFALQNEIDLKDDVLIWVNAIQEELSPNALTYVTTLSEDTPPKQIAEGVREPQVCSDEWVAYIKNVNYYDAHSHSGHGPSSGTIFAYHLPTEQEFLVGNNTDIIRFDNRPNSSFDCDADSLVWINDKTLNLFDFSDLSTELLPTFDAERSVYLDNNVIVYYSGAILYGYDLVEKASFHICDTCFTFGTITVSDGKVIGYNGWLTVEEYSFSDLFWHVRMTKNANSIDW